ncbi:MAG: aspartate/glutamate racemase family protein [Phycisphaerales bacterium JB039]
MAPHIGIVGVSPEGAALAHRLLYRRAAALAHDIDHPRVTLHNEPLALYIEAVRREDWHGVGDLLRRSANILADAGAEFCFTPDNAVQHGIHLAESGSKIPWLAMTDLVAERVAGDGRKIVGLVGTRIVMTGSAYQTHLGLKGVQTLAPLPEEIEDLDRIIFTELIYGQIRAASRSRAAEIVRSLQDRGCEALILAASEAPLLFQDDHGMPLYDAAETLVEGALRRAFS